MVVRIYTQCMGQWVIDPCDPSIIPDLLTHLTHDPLTQLSALTTCIQRPRRPCVGGDPTGTSQRYM